MKAHNREGKERVRKRIAKKRATTLNLGSQAANTEKGATTRKIACNRPCKNTLPGKKFAAAKTRTMGVEF
jgi:hypothetical protein